MKRILKKQIASLFIVSFLLFPSPVGATLEEESQNLTQRQESTLLNWTRQYSPSRKYFYQPHLLIKQAVLAFSELPQAIRYEIFTHNGKTLPLKTIQKHLKTLSIDPFHHPVLSRILDNYDSDEFSKGDPYASLEKRIHKILQLPAPDLRHLRSNMQRRYSIHEIISLLADNKTNDYEIKINGNNIETPDGVGHPIREKLKDGTLLIEMPLSSVLPTQDFLDFHIIAEQAKSMNSKLEGFHGNFSADGRFMIPDQLRRITAYAQKNNGKVLVRLQRNRDGKYYAVSHFSILRFYFPDYDFSHWFSMREDEFLWHHEQVLKGPILYARELFYEVMRLKRLGPQACVGTKMNTTPADFQPIPKEHRLLSYLP